MFNTMENATKAPRREVTSEDVIEVRVIEPGDDCNLYEYDASVEGLRLSGIHHTTQPAPADHAVTADAAVDGEIDLKVLLVAHRSILPGCVVSARPIALVASHHDHQVEQYVVAVPIEDDTLWGVTSVDTLPETRQRALLAYLQATLNGKRGSSLQWGDADQARQAIQKARQAARLARARARKAGSAVPAWKPLGASVSGARRSSDTEPHTEAENAYHQLPQRFQKYVDEYLVDDERILFAVNRPAMRSGLKRTWLAGQTLQEGILFITDQQVALVTENMPPDRTSIKYGYVVHTGAPERVESVHVSEMNRRACFEVTFQAAGGVQHVIWEFPAEAADELNQAANLLRRWKPAKGSYCLQRAQGPEPIEMPLRDPAANDLAEVLPLTTRLTEALADQVLSHERILATALLPAWADKRKVAHLFAVTDQRVLLLPDPLDASQTQPASYRLACIASLEFTSSILASWVVLNVVDSANVRRTVITFPYTAGEFQVCFTILRQQLSVVPPYP